MLYVGCCEELSVCAVGVGVQGTELRHRMMCRGRRSVGEETAMVGAGRTVWVGVLGGEITFVCVHEPGWKHGKGGGEKGGNGLVLSNSDIVVLP